MEKKKENKTTINPQKEQKLETNTPDNTIKDNKIKKEKTPKTKTKTPKKRYKPLSIENPKYGLNQRQKTFCREYSKTGNGKQSAIKAGYAPKTAEQKASMLLRNVKVAEEIQRLNGLKEANSIWTSQQVMEFFTRVAKGEIKDQFGLDATLADRLKAGQEIAKRTVDIDNRMKGVPDGNIVIKVDWRK